MKLQPVAWSLVAVVLFGGTILSAQSLSEIAKKEEERRKAVKGPTKVYTNDDLKKYTPPAPDQAAPATAPVPSPDDPVAAATTKPAAEPPAPPGEATEAKDEAYWKGLMTAARTKLERDESYLEALQSRINALTNDFYARDDPAQRDQIWSQRVKALDELERMKTEVAEDKKAIEKVQEDARREGVPPGWLR